MFNKQDGLLLLVTLSSIAIGIALPVVGLPFAGLPKYCMMALLFLSFLSIRMGGLWQTIRTQIGPIARILLFKLGLLPVAAYCLFHLIAPQYALAALLMSGMSSGVVASFFADRFTVDTNFVLLIVVLSSILVPFTLPVLVSFFIGETMQISLGGMIWLLSMVVFLPLICVQLLRKISPKSIEWMHKTRYPLSLVLFAVTNLGVFSGYAAFFKANPAMMAKAFLVAMGLAAFYMVCGIVATLKKPIANVISTIILFGIMNNVLVLVFGSEFFGALELAVAAIYTIPFFGLILPLRFLQSWEKSQR